MAEVSTVSANDPYGPTTQSQEPVPDLTATLAPEIGNVSAYGNVEGNAAARAVGPSQSTYEQRELIEPSVTRERDVAGPGE